MYTLLILFFISLIGLTVMIGRKIALVRNGAILETSDFHPFVSDFKTLRSFLWRKMRIYGYAGLVFLVREYVNVKSFLIHSYGKIHVFVVNKLKKKNVGMLEDEASLEVSSFLQKISDYKMRIRILKEKIEKQKKMERVRKTQ